jgi:hypothetical protein
MRILGFALMLLVTDARAGKIYTCPNFTWSSPSTTLGPQADGSAPWRLFPAQGEVELAYGGNELICKYRGTVLMKEVSVGCTVGAEPGGTLHRGVAGPYCTFTDPLGTTGKQCFLACP